MGTFFWETLYLVNNHQCPPPFQELEYDLYDYECHEDYETGNELLTSSWFVTLPNCSPESPTMTTSVSWAQETNHPANNGYSTEKLTTTELSEASVLDIIEDKDDETTSLLNKNSTSEDALSKPLEKHDNNILIDKQLYKCQQNTPKNKFHPPITCIEELEMWDE